MEHLVLCTRQVMERIKSGGVANVTSWKRTKKRRLLLVEKMMEAPRNNDESAYSSGSDSSEEETVIPRPDTGTIPQPDTSANPEPDTSTNNEKKAAVIVDSKCSSTLSATEDVALKIKDVGSDRQGRYKTVHRTSDVQVSSPLVLVCC